MLLSSLRVPMVKMSHSHTMLMFMGIRSQVFSTNASSSPPPIPTPTPTTTSQSCRKVFKIKHNLEWHCNGFVTSKISKASTIVELSFRFTLNSQPIIQPLQFKMLLIIIFTEMVEVNLIITNISTQYSSEIKSASSQALVDQDS